MNRLVVSDTPLHGLKIVQRTILGDERGFLSRLFCAGELLSAGLKNPIAQINHTRTQSTGTIRGMHYQNPPHTEIKLVTCLHGAVWDVAVDIRSDSPTFLQWYAHELSSDNHFAMLIPEGFAHGFQTLTDDVEMLYCHSAAHEPTADAGLNPFDPRLAIAWPLPAVRLSARDNGQAMLTPTFDGVHA